MSRDWNPFKCVFSPSKYYSKYSLECEMICWGFILVDVRPPRRTTQCHVLSRPNSEGCKLSKGGGYNTIQQWIGSAFPTTGKFRATDACGKWEPGEQKGGILAEGGENLPSFKSLSDRVTLIGGCEGGSVHQHASEHHRAWVMIRTVHWIIAYRAFSCADDAGWMDWR